ncbi:phosphoribosyltransferase [Actinokineospora bangkokensis]|uniref:Phosphoribosyltransferase domain-containing protein n=1 Tax=Actinokineospora bangkokensis TaxID=1193682 RepID=A0A1Q9LQZ1_9PSEU|nr:phosphoribosyltransferase [Actinokineospora bangkokensis]OLR94438.1 hypothetical protein BJP25_11825 [Actinokineospora bangkokensis]
MLRFRSSPEAAEHIVGALPRAAAIRPNHDEPEWPQRIRMDFTPPDELFDFLALLEHKVLLIKVHRKSILAGAVALDWYQRPDATGKLGFSSTATRVRLLKGYTPSTPTQREAARRELCEHMSEVVTKHLWLATATRILPTPGHSATTPSSGARLGRDLATALKIPITEVSARSAERKQAKNMHPWERTSLIREFDVAEDLTGQTVLVVDDIYHSGATMAGVAFAAQRAGAENVLGLVAARVLRS